MQGREIEGTFPLYVDEAASRGRAAADARSIPRRQISLGTALLLAGLACAIVLLTVDLCIRVMTPPPPSFTADTAPPKALVAPYIYMRTHPSTLIPTEAEYAARRPSGICYISR